MLNVDTYPSNEPGAPRLVLVHGFTQNTRVWKRLAGLLAVRFEVVCVDLPGHGATPAEYDEADLWRAAHLLIKAGGPAFYVGYSLGARVVLHAEIAAPSEVRAAVLIGPKAGFRDDVERRARRLADDLVADRIDALGDDALSEFIDDWLSQSFNNALSEEAKCRGERLQNRAHGLAQSLRHTGSGVQDPIWERLSAVHTPTLLIKGDPDLSSVESEIDDMARVMGNASIAVARTCGHASPFEDPTRIAAMINDFIASL